MSNKSNTIRQGFLGRAFTVIGAAAAVSAAVEGHRRPRSRDLRALGIDPENFGQLGR